MTDDPEPTDGAPVEGDEQPPAAGSGGRPGPDTGSDRDAVEKPSSPGREGGLAGAQGTDSPARRAPWLSTYWCVAYGSGFPLWVFASRIWGYPLDVNGFVMGALVLAWGGTVAYVIGGDAVEAWAGARG